MKKITFFLSLMLLTLCVTNAWGAVYFEDDFSDVGKGDNLTVSQRTGWSSFTKCYAQGNSGLRVGSSNAGGSVTKTAMDSIEGTKDLKVTVYIAKYNTNGNNFTITTTNGTIASVTGVGTLANGTLTVAPKNNAGITGVQSTANWNDDYKTEFIIKGASGSTTIKFATNKRAILGPITIEDAPVVDAPAVDAPTFSATNANFTEAFELTISSAEGTTLKYTLDNSDPNTSSTAVTVATNIATVSIPTKSIVVKAIACSGDEVSYATVMTYCYVNTPETAYTVAEAMEVIDAGLGLENELYIKGTISKIESFNSQFGSITYWIEDEEGNEFECYSGLGLNKAKFTSVDDLVVGSKVVVCGTMKKYKTIYEFDYNNYIVSLTLPSYTVTATAENGSVEGLAADGKYEHGAEATLTATPASGYKFVNWTSGETVVSTENPYKFTVTADVALVANFIKKTISYELNGGAFPEVKVPTNEELALVFKQEYAEYFAIEGLTDTDMKREVGNFIYVTNSKGGDAIKFITENANWKWLHDYILTVAGNIPEGTNVGFYWRANLDGFFHCKNAVAVGGVASADYTVAGKPEAWGAAYQAAHAVVLPTEPVDAPYTLPTPVKEGYKFVGWYDNAEGTGEPMTVIPAGWDGTLYAIWVEIYTITLEAENGTVEGAGKYEHGAEATLAATAAEGYEFTCWTSGEDTVSTANPYKFTVTADVTLVANFKEAAPTYDLELVAKDLYSASNEVMTQFEGSNSLNPDMTISVTLFASKYGTYTSTGAEEDEFKAFYAGSQILGELTYSYSDELKSDLVVIIGTITDEEETSTIKVTMYEEYLEPTDVVVLNNLQKNVQKMGWMSNLMLFNAANDTIITISGCDGTYGKYSAWGTFGADELEGKGEWKNDGENDVFVGVLYNADKTKVFQVTATTPAEKIKEYTYELADVSFTLSEVSNTLIIEAYAEEPEPVQVYLELAGWTPEQTIYAVGEMYGSIANLDNTEGADVANLTYEVESYLEGKELTIRAKVEDAAGNTYLLVLTGEYDSTTTALDNLNTTVAPVKMIENGQLIIIKNGVQYNAQGQVIK